MASSQDCASSQVRRRTAMIGVRRRMGRSMPSGEVRTYLNHLRGLDVEVVMVYFLLTSAFADELWRCGRPRELLLSGSVLSV